MEASLFPLYRRRDSCRGDVSLSLSFSSKTSNKLLWEKSHLNQKNPQKMKAPYLVAWWWIGLHIGPGCSCSPLLPASLSCLSVLHRGQGRNVVHPCSRWHCARHGHAKGILEMGGRKTVGIRNILRKVTLKSVTRSFLSCAYLLSLVSALLAG